MSDQNQLVEAPQQEVYLVREPEAILQEAKKAAQALISVISQKKDPVKFNGNQYIEFEDWQTVAKFYGITARVKHTQFIDYGGVKGFEASAEAVRADGFILSSADAMCLNDEENWSVRAKFQWVNGKREKIGDVPVPFFQLRSMAQTRACAKALRNVLAWVVVLAGFKPTPAEEMVIDREDNYPSKPAAKTEAAPMPTNDVPGTKITGIKMISKRDGVCWMCSQEVKTGTDIIWDKDNKRVYHLQCCQ